MKIIKFFILKNKKMFKPDTSRPIFKLIPGAVDLLNQGKCLMCKELVPTNYFPMDSPQGAHLASNSQNVQFKIEYMQTGICPKCQVGEKKYS